MAFPREDFYKLNISQSREAIMSFNRQIDRLSLMRLALIVLGGVTLFQVIQSQQVTLTLLCFIGLLVLFFLMVSKQSKLTVKKDDQIRFLKINENEIALLTNYTANIYNSGAQYADDRHAYASDLDVFGEGSLFQLLNRCATAGGMDILARWLSSPSGKNDVDARQALVSEISEAFPFWQRIQSQLYFSLGSDIDYKQKFQDFLSTSFRLTNHRFLTLYVKLAPWLMLLSLAGSGFHSASLGIFIILGIFHFLVSLYYSPKITRISAHLSKAGDALGSFAVAFTEIEQKRWESAYAQELLKAVSGSGQPVSLSIRSLSLMINRLDVRHNVFIGSFLNIFMLWDIKHVLALESWRERESAGIPVAFELLATIEAVGSLATFRFNRPSTVFPVLREQGEHILTCRQVAHPFILEEDVVRNDYTLADHQLALVTGSNMAGKSTFLRTIGINAVLAYSGAPVVAESMEISVMHLVTYMRIRDSLNESTSTFKAELDRIMMVLQQVEDKADTLFLLDEMLRGTNSVDKYLGSKAIIEKLIAFKGVGMVATHDLKLAELADTHPGYVKNFHFDIQVHGEDMLFDYLLKDGPCTIFNASLLLRKIGIHI